MSLNQQLAHAIRPEPAAESEEGIVVETRFGVFEFAPANTIHMPRGPHGFTECHDFGLANLPEPVPEHFKLLQSLDDAQLSFIVTVLDPESGAVLVEDLKDGAASVGLTFESAIFLLIVTLRVADGGTAASVNLRAPIVLDMERRIARQVVLANNAYPIQQPLGEPAATS